jgi:hypothetical protein
MGISPMYSAFAHMCGALSGTEMLYFGLLSFTFRLNMQVLQLVPAAPVLLHNNVDVICESAALRLSTLLCGGAEV